MQTAVGTYTNNIKRRWDMQHTLFDFITHIKGVEYIISVTFIAGYMIFWEALKPKPFHTAITAGREDLKHVTDMGREQTLRSIGRIAAAPFIGLAYVVALPFSFAIALGSALLGGAATLAGKEASFGWSPVAAYLTGKKKEKTEDKKDEKK